MAKNGKRESPPGSLSRRDFLRGSAAAGALGVTATVTTVVCADCDGLTYVRRPCACRDGHGERIDYPGTALPLREQRPAWAG